MTKQQLLALLREAMDIYRYDGGSIDDLVESFNRTNRVGDLELPVLCEWVSVDDELPKADGEYWVSFIKDGKQVSCNGYFFTETGLFDSELEDFPIVTHWAEITAPQPPEGV